MKGRKQKNARSTETADNSVFVPIQSDVVIVYPYVQHGRDAVGACVDQLADYLGEHSRFKTQTLCIRDDTATVSNFTTTNKKLLRAMRAYDQLKFLWTVFFYLRTLPATRHFMIVTVDAPTGIGIPVHLAKWLNPQISHIAWVMDLYRLRSQGRSSILTKLRRYIELKTIVNADYIVTLGECMRRNLILLTGREIVVLPIWQDEHWLHPEYGPRATRPDQRPINIVYSGSARIGIHPLSRLADAVIAYNAPDRLRLIIRGQGDEIENLRSNISRTSNTVLFEEPVAYRDAPQALASADIHLVSLAKDATGTCVPSKTYASMAVGRPLIYVGDPTGQAARDILDGECGFVVKPDTSMSDVLDTILDSATDLDRMGTRGYTFFLRNRSISAVGPRWSNFLKEVQSNANPTRP